MADTPTVYVVIDMRTVWDAENQSWACVVRQTPHQNRNGADERYHLAVAEAARTTTYPAFAAVLLDNCGNILASDHYEYPVTQPQPETEGE